MTRKDELKERAKRRIDSIYGTRAEHCMGASYDEYVQEVLEDFQQVEREVWVKVMDQIRDGQEDKIGLWHWARRQGLGS